MARKKENYLQQKKVSKIKTDPAPGLVVVKVHQLPAWKRSDRSGGKRTLNTDKTDQVKPPGDKADQVKPPSKALIK